MTFPLVILARFNVPMADDYCFASQIRVVGFFRAQWEYYTTTYGRYTALALLSLNPMVLSSRYLWFAHVFPLILILALATAFYSLFRAVTEEESRIEPVALTALAMVAYVSQMPSVFQGLYWWSSACCFDVGSILSGFAAAALIRSFNDADRARMSRAPIVAAICGALAMGTNEVTTLNLNLILVCFVASRWKTVRLAPRLWRIITVWEIATILALFAPGNLKKFGYSFGMSPVAAVRHAVIDATNLVQQWSSAGPLLALTIVAICIWSRPIPSRGVPSTMQMLAASIALMWFVVFMDEAFMNKSVGVGPHPLRAMNTMYFAFLFFWGCMTRAAAVAITHIAPLWPRWSIVRATAAVVALGIASLRILSMPRSNVVVAYQDLLSGRASAYAAQMKDRFRRIASASVVQVPPLTVAPTTIMTPSFDITEDIQNVINGCSAGYFGLRGLVVTNDETLMRIQALATKYVPPHEPVFMYAPSPMARAMFEPLRGHVREFLIAHPFMIQVRAPEAPFVYIFWDVRDSGRAEIQQWRALGKTIAVNDRFGLLQISSQRYLTNMPNIVRVLTDEVDRRIASSRSDPFLAALLIDEYAWMRSSLPHLYERIRRLHEESLAPIADSGVPVGQYATLNAYRWTAPTTGVAEVDLLFRCTAASSEDLRVLIHAVAPPEERKSLPLDRQQLGWDDWSFEPAVPTSKWKRGEFVLVRHTVATKLKDPQMKFGLVSSTMGVIGVVEADEIASRMNALAEVEPRLEAARSDPFALWSLLQEYEWTRTRMPALHARIAKAYETAVPSIGAAGVPLRHDITLHAFRFRPRGDGKADIYVAFRSQTPIQENDMIVVHAIAIADEVSDLPASRQQYRYDDWSFAPQPATSTWKAGEISIAHTTVATKLVHPQLKFGLASPTKGVLGTVEATQIAAVADARAIVRKCLNAPDADVFTTWALLRRYAPLRQQLPDIVENVERAYRAQIAHVSPETLKVTADVSLHGYKWLPPEHGMATLFLLFRTDTPIAENDMLVVHATPKADELPNLPDSRKQYRYDDWSFPPDPATSTWKPMEYTIVQTVIATKLRHPDLRIGLASPTKGVLGIVDLPINAK